jgi:ABC-type multidrug transport system fused ATPase/permease subunit
MTDLFQTVYDAALLWVNALVVSRTLNRRRMPRFFCPVVFLVSPVLMELAFAFAPPFTQAAFLECLLKEIILLPLMVVVFKGKFFQKTLVFFTLMSLAALFKLVPAFGARLFFSAGPGFELCKYFGAWGLLILYVFLFFRFGRGPAGNLFALTDKLAWFLYTLGASFSYFSMKTAEAAFQGGDLWEISPGISQVAVFINILIALVNLAVIFTAISAAGKSAGESYELYLAKEVIASEDDYYKRLDRILQEIRVLRHDYKYQIGVIDELAQISKARHIRDFLADARSYYSQTEPVVYCENLVISALLAHYTKRFDEAGITFTVHAVLPVEIPQVDKSLSPLNNYEICIVLGNLLENAFEAAMKVPEEDRRISFDISLSSKKLLIEGKNTFDGEIMAGEGRTSSANIPRSRKGTGGGYGLRSVAAVCKRHGGEYLPEWTEKEYTIRLLLNL